MSIKKINKKILNYMLIAKQEAEKSPVNTKYAAILVKNGKIISKGYNYYTRNKIFQESIFTIHAEVACINNCYEKHKIKYADMYIVRIKNNEFLRSAPCIYCNKFIRAQKYKIKNVYYLY
jgi:deoxycytidylate deaminase